MSVEKNSRQLSSKTLFMWLVTIGFPVAILCIPTNDVFSLQIRLFLALTLFAILTFAFENMPQTMIAILLPIAYVVTGIAPAEKAFGPWMQYVPWMVLGGLILADALNSAGLLKRIAYKCIIITGASYNGILIGLALAGTVLNIFIPSQAVVPMAALSYGICVALNLGYSRESAGIMLTAAMGALLPELFFYNPNTMIVFGVGESVAGPTPITWMEYFLNNCISMLFLVIMVIVAIFIFKPKQTINSKEYFISEYEKMGTMNIREKKGAAVCIFLFIVLLTGKYHGIELGWCFASIPMLLFCPGIDVGRPEDLRNANYGFILFVTACMCIGSVAGYLGIGQIVSTIAIPMLEGHGSTFVMMFVWTLVMLLNFLLTPLAIQAAFTGPLVDIVSSLNINPQALYILIKHACDQVILPYEYAQYLIYFSFGLIPLKEFIKLQGTKMLVSFLFVLLILLPFWRLVGFLFV